MPDNATYLCRISVDRVRKRPVFQTIVWGRAGRENGKRMSKIIMRVAKNLFSFKHIAKRSTQIRSLRELRFIR